MARRKRFGRRTPTQAAADRRSDDIARRLGRMLKGARLALRLRQAEAAERAGMSRSTWSGLEVGGDGRVTLATWQRAAAATGTVLDAYLKQASSAAQLRDAVHLRNQELVIRVASGGGWRSLPEEPIDRDARTSRAADVLLQRGPEWALLEVWDWFDDVGASLRDWDRRLAAVERYAIARAPADGSTLRCAGCWLVRATRRNRQLLSDHRYLFDARFPGPGPAWLRALAARRVAMPDRPALLWVSVSGDRLFAARLGRGVRDGTVGGRAPASSAPEAILPAP